MPVIFDLLRLKITATLNDLNYDFEDAYYFDLLSACMNKTKPTKRLCSLTILEMASNKLSQLGYQPGEVKFLSSSIKKGSLLFRAIVESLNRLINSYLISTTKEKIQSLADRSQELVEDGEGSEVLQRDATRISNSPLATFILVHRERAKILINKGQKDELQLGEPQKISILHIASAEGSEEIVEACIQSNMDLNIVDVNEWTPLHWAASAGKTDICELLLDQHAKADAKNDQGSTPLHIAANMGYGDLINLFITGKVNLDAKD